MRKNNIIFSKAFGNKIQMLFILQKKFKRERETAYGNIIWICAGEYTGAK